MHLSRESRATLVAAVILAGIPVLSVASPAPAAIPKAGTCTIVGTSDDDVLTGTDGDDVICGLGGDDKITGGGGDDVLRGGGGADVVRGGPGDDTVAGGGGDDRVFGQAGDDKVRGDAGDDEVVGGPGDDRLGGYKGADELDGVDNAGAADVLRCGPGPDTAAADPGDQVKKNCETIVQNDPPTDISLVPATIPENEPIGTDIGDLTATDPDAGDSHTFTLVTGTGSTDNALVRIDGDSLESNVRYDFEADSSFSVRVRATDDAGEFTEKAFTVTVTNANDAPVAVDDDATTNEDTSLVVLVSGPSSFAANDTDQDGDSLAVTAATAVAGGTASVAAGMVTFAPNPNLCGADAGAFDYTVADGLGGTDVGRVTVDITCVDDFANAVDDSRTVAEDSGGTVFDVLSNDSDPEGDPIAVTGVTQPANLSSSTSSTPTGVTYTPGANYCNDPGAPADDTFTYSVTDGDSATVSVKVACVNDAPDAVNDTRTTAEDTTLVLTVATAGSPTTNDTDVDGDTLTVTAVATPVGGTVSVTAGTVTFVPTPNLCGVGAGSFGYTVSDGLLTDTATVTVDITCVDDPANAVNDTATVAEDSGGTTIDVLANDTDVESNPITVTDASDPAGGATSFTPSDVTYTPDQDFCGTDTFTYEVNGGEDTATVTVTVTCANDAPVVDLDTGTAGNGSSSTFTESDPHTGAGVLIAPNTDISDVDDTIIESATVTLTNRPDASNESIAPPGSLPGGITVTGSTGPGGQQLVFTGPASIADFEAAISGIRYDNTVNPPDPADRTITVVVNDGDADSVSRTATVQVVPLNVAPVNSVPGAQSVAEDGSLSFTSGSAITVSDVDNASLSVQVTVTHGTFTLSGTSGLTVSGDGTSSVTFSGSIANLNAALNNATYAPALNYTGPAQLTIVTSDASLSDTDSVDITVTPVNDAPTATNLSAAESYTEDAPLNLTNIVVSDVDSTNATVTLTLSTPAFGSLSTGTSGSVTSTYVGATGVWTASGAIGDVNTLLAGVILTPAPNVNATFTIATSVSDGVAPAVTGSKLMTGIAVNDAPTSVAPGDQSTNEDTPKAITGMSVADIDNADLTVTLTVTNGTLTLASTAGLVFGPGDGTSDTTMTFTGATASVNTAIASVSYNPAANYNGPSVLTFSVSDGVAAPVVKTVNITVVPVNDAPTAVAHTVMTSSGIGLTISAATDTGELKEGATDVDDAFGDLTVQLVAGSLSPATATLTLVSAADGSFYVEPPGGLSGNGAVTFAFRVCDDNAGDPNQCSTQQTQTLDVSGPDRWFVDEADAAACAAACNGSRTKPLVGLAALPGGRGTGDRVFVFSGTYAVGHTFPTGEHLVGQGATGSFDTLLGVTVPGNGTLDARPALGGAKPTIPGTVTLATNAALRGVTISTGASTALTEPAGTTSGLAVTETSLTTTTGSTLLLDQAAGSLQLDGVTHNGAGTGVSATQNSASLSFTGGVDISSGTGTAFSVTGGGTVVVTDPNAVGAAPDNTLLSTTGTALNVQNATIAAGGLNFKSISANGAPNGIVLSTTGSTAGLTVTGTGSTDGSGGTIQNITNRGASFTSARDISLSNMTFTNVGTTNGADSTNPNSTCGSIDPAVVGGGDNTGCNAGINAQSVTNLTLTNVDMNGGAQQGINGRNITNLVMSNSNVLNFGNETREDGIRIFNLLGTNTISNTNVTGNEEIQLNYLNSSGSSTLTVTGGSFSNSAAPNGVDGIQVHGEGTSNVTIDVNGATLSNNAADGFFAVGSDTSTMDVTVQNSAMASNLNSHVNLGINNGANMSYDVVNNGTAASPLLNAGGNAINVNLALPSTGTLQGNISGNHIGSAAVPDSGSNNGGNGVRIVSNGNGTQTVAVTNNVIREIESGVGVSVIGRDGASTTNATITGNLIRISDPANLNQGIYLQSGAVNTDTTTVNAQIGGAAAFKNDVDVVEPTTDDIRVRNRFAGTVFRIEGLSSATSTPTNNTAAVASYIASQNTLTGTVSATVSGNMFDNIVNVPMPV